MEKNCKTEFVSNSFRSMNSCVSFQGLWDICVRGQGNSVVKSCETMAVC